MEEIQQTFRVKNAPNIFRNKSINRSCSNCACVQIIFTALHCWNDGKARTNSITEWIIVPYVRYLLADKSSSPFFLWKLERKLLRNLSILQQFGITISYLCPPDLLEVFIEPRIRSIAFWVRTLWCTVPAKYIRYLCPASVCVPACFRGGEGEGVGGPNSDDWRKSLTLSTLWSYLYNFVDGTTTTKPISEMIIVSPKKNTVDRLLWRCSSGRENWTRTSGRALRSWWKGVNHYTGEGHQLPVHQDLRTLQEVWVQVSLPATAPSHVVTPTWLNTQLLQVMILRSFCTTQTSLLLFHLPHILPPSFPPSSSPFLLSRRSPLSDLPIRAVDPFSVGGKYVTDATLTLNPDYKWIGVPHRCSG